MLSRIVQDNLGLVGTTLWYFFFLGTIHSFIAKSALHYCEWVSMTLLAVLFDFQLAENCIVTQHKR
ncbi:hypothetical protein BDL97_02G082200 [Sphagnum fallax]|nr:hypothetical protein BDL97_02G082200 [Sphagnum fallax]